MLIRIVMGFTLFFFLSGASANTTDTVWAAQNSGYITSSGSLSFENYLVRAEAVGNKQALLTIYQNLNQVAQDEIQVDESIDYETLRITLLGIRGEYSWISLSKRELKDVWIPLPEKELKWGENYAVENYTLSIDTFGTDSINLTLSNTSVTGTDVFYPNEAKDYEHLRIAVKEIDRTGSITLALFTNRPPAIQAEISTDKDEYFPDEIARVTVNVTSGLAQNIVGITLEGSAPVEVQPDIFSTTSMAGTQTFNAQVTNMPAESTVTINARIETRDYFGTSSVTSFSKDIFITPVVSIRKIVPPDPDDADVPVELEIYNSGSDQVSILVQDTIPEELGSKSLTWDVELGPKNSTTITYTVHPQTPGLYLLPAATAQWNDQSATSKKGKITMHMPYLRLVKTAEYREERTVVKLDIQNTGDRPAQVTVSDNVPPGSSVIIGESTWSGKVEGGETASFRYALAGTVGNLPAASATYRDIRGTIRHATSNTIEGGPENSEIAPPEDTLLLNGKQYELMSFMVVSFLVIAGIIGSMASIAYVVTRLKKRG